ncbi:hypothetical protein CR513_07142, partial [Mucuna pruriens]
MKFISSVLVVLLVLSIAVGPPKVIEARRCDEKLNESCEENTCNNDCHHKHGNLASALIILLVLFIGIDSWFSIQCIVENEGPLKVIESKICDVKLYDYCDQDCYIDCPKKYGQRAIGICDWNMNVCICRGQC